MLNGTSVLVMWSKTSRLVPKLILIFPVTELASSEHNSNFIVAAMLISTQKSLREHLKLHTFRNLFFLSRTASQPVCFKDLRFNSVSNYIQSFHINTTICKLPIQVFTICLHSSSSAFYVNLCFGNHCHDFTCHLNCFLTTWKNVCTDPF